MFVILLELKSESVFGGTEEDKQMRWCEREIFISVILPLKIVRKKYIHLQKKQKPI